MLRCRDPALSTEELEVSAAVRARYVVKSALRPLIFRYPPIGLQPERLHLWLGALKDTRAVEGAVVEVGCSTGGTAAFAGRMLRRLAPDRRYLCIDTFGGFVDEQFEKDQGQGTVTSSRRMFDANSPQLVRRNLDALGAPQVELLQADIVRLEPAALPAQVSAALIDVDLEEPVYAGLTKLYERLVPGGVMLVDDCPEEYHWQARKGYERFMAELGQAPVYDSGMGIVSKRA
jgi:O-methyltransferase